MIASPKFTEYTITASGETIMGFDENQSPALFDPPVIMADVVPMVISYLPLLKQIAFAETDSQFKSQTLRILKRTMISQILIYTVESEFLVRIDVTVAGKEGLTVDFEGPGNKITMDTFVKAFDYLTKIIAYTNCINASIIVEPVWFPSNLDIQQLPSHNLHKGLVKVRELSWGYGAPLELFVQLVSEKIFIDTMFTDVRDGANAIVEKIRVNGIVPK